MTFQGKPIERISLPESGISYSTTLETIFVARWRGYSDAYFESLPFDEQARTVAAYRSETQIQAVLALDASERTKHPNRSRRRRR